MADYLYLAGPFFDDEQIDRITRVEAALAANPTLKDFFSPRKFEYTGLEFGTKEWRKAVYQNNIEHLEKANAVLAIVDFEDKQVDSGTAVEIGHATKAGIPVIIFQEKDIDLLNVMISDSLTAYLTTIDEITNYDFDKLPKNEYNGSVT